MTPRIDGPPTKKPRMIEKIIEITVVTTLQVEFDEDEEMTTYNITVDELVCEGKRCQNPNDGDSLIEAIEMALQSALASDHKITDAAMDTIYYYLANPGV